MNLIKELIELEDEPLVSEENNELLNKIVKIEKVSDFNSMELNDEKLEELLGNLMDQENFSKEVKGISKSLGRVKAIVLETDEEDYI